MWEVTNSVIEAMTEDHNYEEKKLQYKQLELDLIFSRGTKTNS
ncbi:hypothetical protein [Crocosphaera sp.]|nr:hypothetical protein [Crocosphaera sp.]